MITMVTILPYYHGQAAADGDVFDALLKYFDAAFECFASPLNCRYGRFCSAFDDTDRLFGSCGSFFNFHPRQGSFQANPPFVDSVILAMAKHMEELLTISDAESLPLSFVVIVPTWSDTPGHGALESAAHLKHQIQINQADHGYVEGKQALRKTRYRVASFHTSIFWLQSSAGASRWPVTDESVEALRAAFAPKQAAEIGASAASVEYIAADIAPTIPTSAPVAAAAAAGAVDSVPKGPVQEKIRPSSSSQARKKQKTGHAGQNLPGKNQKGGKRTDKFTAKVRSQSGRTTKVKNGARVHNKGAQRAQGKQEASRR